MTTLPDPTTHRLAMSGRTTLSVHHYRPARTLRRAPAIVLVHGLLSSSEIFDVPHLGHLSLARALARSGFHVVTYDQRGTGDSVADSADYGLAEHALTDLPAIIRFACTVSGTDVDHTILGGHSLGGLIIYLQQIAARRDTHSLRFGPAISRVFTIASPASFDPSWRPWNLIRRGGRELVAALDPDGDGVITREDFVAGQSRLVWPRIGRLVKPEVIRFAIRAGIRLRWLVPLLLRNPLPTFIYGRSDFSAASFWRLLQSRALDRASSKLLEELVDATACGGCVTVQAQGEQFRVPEDLGALRDLTLLAFTSRADTLVPPRSVEAILPLIAGARTVTTESEYGMSSGHAGYLFRPGLAEQIERAVVEFCGPARHE